MYVSVCACGVSAKCFPQPYIVLLDTCSHCKHSHCTNHQCDTVEVHGCVVDIVTKFIDEQYTTINQSTAGRFDLTWTEGPCKQLTKTLRSKRPAVDWLRVVYCSSVNFVTNHQCTHTQHLATTRHCSIPWWYFFNACLYIHTKLLVECHCPRVLWAFIHPGTLCNEPVTSGVASRQRAPFVRSLWIPQLRPNEATAVGEQVASCCHSATWLTFLWKLINCFADRHVFATCPWILGGSIVYYIIN